MNRFKISYLLFIFMSLPFASCSKDDNSQSEENEKLLLQEYITKYGITVSPSASGLYTLPSIVGTGSSPQSGGFVLVNYSAKWLSTGKVYDTNDTISANDGGLTVMQPLGGPFKFQIGSTDIWGTGLSEGLLGMKEGGYSQFIIPSSLWDNDYNTRIYDVELLKVYTSPLAFEREQISYYLDSMSNVLSISPKLTIADSTKKNITGVYYMETLKGTGDSIVDGKTVTLSFSAYLLPYKGLSNERLYARSTSSVSIVLNSGDCLDGLTEGIRHMRKGGKGIIVIPYYRGYGTTTWWYYTQIMIPMYSTIIYKVEISAVN
jgi:FKBP-type peptidyl-prolyl cis-trans isomerase